MITNPMAFNKKQEPVAKTDAVEFKHMKLPLAVISKIEATLRRYGFTYRTTNEHGGILYTKPMSDEQNDQIVILFCVESKENINSYPYVRFTYGKKNDPSTIKKFFEFKEITLSEEMLHYFKEFIEGRVLECGNIR